MAPMVPLLAAGALAAAAALLGTAPSAVGAWDKMFMDVTAAVGLSNTPALKYGGPVVADLNQDGAYDLVLVQHNKDPVLVYYGAGDGTFTKAPNLLPWIGDIHGAAAGDVDLDGDLDVLATRGGSWGQAPAAPYFMRNTNGKAFVDDTAAAGLDVMGGRGRSPRFVDLDGDGDLDLVLFHYKVVSGNLPRQQVYENTGGGKFVFRNNTGLEHTSGEQMILTDFDNDGLMDIVSFPWFRLYRQTAPFQFADETWSRMRGIPDFVKRVAPTYAAVELDFDRDGRWDLYLARRGGADVLLRNTGAGYADVTAAAGIPDYDTSGVTAGDFDNDGWTDLMVFRSGTDTQRREPDLLLRNNGDGTFRASTSHGATAASTNGRGDQGQAFDYDGDGRLDVLVGNGDRDNLPAAGTWTLYRNILSTCEEDRHYLTVRVRRSWPMTATAMGALVTVKVGGVTLMRRVGSAGGCNHQSQLDMVHFGLGSAKVVDELQVKWSDGSVSPVQRNVEVDQTVSLGR